MNPTSRHFLLAHAVANTNCRRVELPTRFGWFHIRQALYAYQNHHATLSRRPGDTPNTRSFVGTVLGDTRAVLLKSALSMGVQFAGAMLGEHLPEHFDGQPNVS